MVSLISSFHYSLIIFSFPNNFLNTSNLHLYHQSIVFLYSSMLSLSYLDMSNCTSWPNTHPLLLSSSSLLYFPFCSSSPMSASVTLVGRRGLALCPLLPFFFFFFSLLLSSRVSFLLLSFLLPWRWWTLTPQWRD